MKSQLKDVRDYTVHEEVLVPSAPGQKRSGEGSAVLLKDGRILLVYSAFPDGGGDHDHAQLVQRISNDGGCTWSEPELFLEKVGGLNVMSVSLLRLQDNSLACIFLSKQSLDDCRPWFISSKNEGKSWSAVRPMIERIAYHTVNNDRLLQTSNGRLVVPCACSVGKEAPSEYECGAVYSDDGGDTWRRGVTWKTLRAENIIEPKVIENRKYWEDLQNGHAHVQEPGVIELRDGRLMMWVRTTVGYAYCAHSADGGETWSDFKPMPDLVSPCAPQSIQRLPGTDRLICIYNDHHGVGFDMAPSWHWRTPLSAAVSDDEGESWSLIGHLEPDITVNYCYVSILFFEDTALFTYYQSVNVEVDGEIQRRNLRHLKLKVVRQSFFK